MPTLNELVHERRLSAIPSCMTEYQLGYELHWWLREFPPEPFRTDLLGALCAVPIVSDEAEAWIQAIPLARRITKDEALKAIAIMRSTPGPRLDRLSLGFAELELKQAVIEAQRARLLEKSAKNSARLRQVASALLVKHDLTDEDLHAAAATFRGHLNTRLTSEPQLGDLDPEHFTRQDWARRDEWERERKRTEAAHRQFRAWIEVNEPRPRR